MIVRVIPVGDLALQVLPSGKKDFRLTSTVAEYVTIKIAARFKFWLGEWFADLRQGMPYRERVFVKGADLQELRGLFVRAVQIPEVARVITMRLTPDRAARKLTVFFELLLADGSTLTVDGEQDARFILDVPPGAG